jgi:hypothetical protein
MFIRHQTHIEFSEKAITESGLQSAQWHTHSFLSPDQRFFNLFVDLEKSRKIK